jgi:DNA-directed RNA polymerase specialized sigma24 family protein
LASTVGCEGKHRAAMRQEGQCDRSPRKLDPCHTGTPMSEPDSASDEALRAIIVRGEAIAREWVGERHAREIAQGIAIAYWEQLRDGRAPVVRDLDAWLARAIRRQILDDRKVGRRQEAREHQAAATVHHGQQSHLHPAGGVEEEELIALLGRALAEMSAQQGADWKHVYTGGHGAAMRRAAERGATVEAVQRNVQRATTSLLDVARQYLNTGTTPFGSDARRGSGTAEARP